MKISEIYDYFCKLFVSKQKILSIDTCKKDLITFCWNVAVVFVWYHLWVVMVDIVD